MTFVEKIQKQLRDFEQIKKEEDQLSYIIKYCWKIKGNYLTPELERIRLRFLILNYVENLDEKCKKEIRLKRVLEILKPLKDEAFNKEMTYKEVDEMRRLMMQE